MTGHWREGPHEPGTESAIHAWLPPRSTGHQRSARRRACRSVQPGSLNPSQQPGGGQHGNPAEAPVQEELRLLFVWWHEERPQRGPGSARTPQQPHRPAHPQPGRDGPCPAIQMTPIDANSLIGAGLGRAGPTSARGLRRTAGRSAPGWSATARCAPRHRLSSAVYRLRGRAGGRGQRAELRPGRGPGAVSADRWRPAG
jgi:hypothetical protein